LDDGRTFRRLAMMIGLLANNLIAWPRIMGKYMNYNNIRQA
jgi:hypothetical protein